MGEQIVATCCDLSDMLRTARAGPPVSMCASLSLTSSTLAAMIPSLEKKHACAFPMLPSASVFLTMFPKSFVFLKNFGLFELRLLSFPPEASAAPPPHESAQQDCQSHPLVFTSLLYVSSTTFLRVPLTVHFLGDPFCVTASS